MPATTPAARRPPTSSAAPSDAGPSDAAAGLDDLTYEQAREELVGVVARLEAGGETLEGSLALWERGEALAARCQQWLDGARARLDAARGVVPTTRTGPPGPDESEAPTGEPDDVDEGDRDVDEDA